MVTYVAIVAFCYAVYSALSAYPKLRITYSWVILAYAIAVTLCL